MQEKQKKVNIQTKRACAKIHPNIYRHRANIKKHICMFASLYNSRVASYMKFLNFWRRYRHRWWKYGLVHIRNKDRTSTEVTKG